METVSPLFETDIEDTSSEMQEMIADIGEILTDYISQRSMFEEGEKEIAKVLQSAKDAGFNMRAFGKEIVAAALADDGWTRADFEVVNDAAKAVVGKNIISKKEIRQASLPDYDDDWGF